MRSHTSRRSRPEHIQIRADLPFSEGGKLLRRVLRDELAIDIS